MRLRRPSTFAALSLTSALLFAFVALVSGKKSAPEISRTEFDHQPRGLFYFDDSDVVIVTDPEAGVVYRSTDAGAEWNPIKKITAGQAFEVFKHPFDNHVAVVLGTQKEHWITKDQGETWNSFKTSMDPVVSKVPLSFHATDSERILFMGQDCEDWSCFYTTWYTTDGFDTIERLREETIQCIWAKTDPIFSTGDEDLDRDLTLCIVEGRYSTWSSDYRLLMSSDYFVDDEREPLLAVGRTVQGIISIAGVKRYIMIAQKSEMTDELALYVTDDTMQWHRADFGLNKVVEEAYTVLESTNYSLQVDVLTTRPTTAMGVLFTSNSNGTYFTESTEHTNRNFAGRVDFEKIQGIQGIVLVNTVDNWEEVEQSWYADKKIKSQISFDDGRTFQSLKADGEDLHLHSVTEMEQHNGGRIFSSPAPGIVMGVGNTGKYLKTWEECDLYVSDDAGLTWMLALEEAHIYEIGDQGAVLVAMYDEGATDQLAYSLNHGRDWDTVKLKDKVNAQALTTVPDATSLKFILMGTEGRGAKTKYYIYSIDFAGLHERKCEDSDFETWHARVDEDGNPTCLMGHTQSYRRRKADADCFVAEEFKDPKPKFSSCKCSEADFECDVNFIRSADRKDCLPVGKVLVPEGQCQNIEDMFMGSSGWRLIPGNACDRDGGVEMDKPIEHPCSDSIQPPANGKISTEITRFRASQLRGYHYLERAASSSGDDETLVMRTDQRKTYRSFDHGKNWEEIIEDEEVVAIYPHAFNNDIVYFITPSKTVYYSKDRAKHIHYFEAPEEPNTDHLQILGFHPKETDWLLWTGARNCGFFDDDCHTVSHVSTKGGEEWTVMLPYVRECAFVWREGRQENEKLVYCEQYRDEDPANDLRLMSSEDFFQTKTDLFGDVVRFAMMSEYIVVATRNSTDTDALRLDASVDGKTFADAQFPSNFRVTHQQAYTVLDSSTHSIFLHVTVNNREEGEYGSIIKSNSNGTSYVMSLNEVNRNSEGYVDFEKMLGLEGVALVNVVANPREADSGASKKLKTMITHSDGAEWTYIKPPAKDVDGKAFPCEDAILEKCSLHLHGYTERKDPPRDTFSSPSAIGLMMGVGNVGDYLGRYAEGDTYITRDGGITWSQAIKGRYMWEYGDQGSIIVIVDDMQETNLVYYTLDEGETWTKYEFTEPNNKMRIDDISTVPSDTSRNFLLWARSGGDLVTINLDFSGLTDVLCRLDEDHPTGEGSDYDLWEPKHPLQENNCLFGHVAQYHRKKPNAKCYNGRKIDHLHNIARNCSCTRQDFECDYNYERQKDGSCALVPGLNPLSPVEACAADSDLVEYYEPTGYRRIPLTTCQSGKEMDKASRSHPCPGKEQEYHERKGLSGFLIFLIVVVCAGAAGGAGYWVWRTGAWEAKFGRIQLGDTARNTFDAESPLVRYPVVAMAAVVAVLAAVPLLVSSVGRSVRGKFGRGYGGRTYTSRSDFGRGRGTYAVVDNDEGELLGDESDEEV